LAKATARKLLTVKVDCMLDEHLLDLTELEAKPKIMKLVFPLFGMALKHG
jgi:hypothetical protein